MINDGGNDGGVRNVEQATCVRCGRAFYPGVMHDRFPIRCCIAHRRVIGVEHGGACGRSCSRANEMVDDAHRAGADAAQEMIATKKPSTW